MVEFINNNIYTREKTTTHCFKECLRSNGGTNRNKINQMTEIFVTSSCIHTLIYRWHWICDLAYTSQIIKLGNDGQTDILEIHITNSRYINIVQLNLDDPNTSYRIFQFFQCLFSVPFSFYYYFY